MNNFSVPAWLSRSLTYLKELYFFYTSKWRDQIAGGLKKYVTPALAGTIQRLEMKKRYKVNIGNPSEVVILLIGCGGTGSFAAHILAQFGDWAKQNGLDMRLYFIDPDQVERKNLVRQNFCEAEIGQYKAKTLAWRFNLAFGLNILPLTRRFSSTMLDLCKPAQTRSHTLMIIVGAVDNNQTRHEIAEALAERLNGKSRAWHDDTIRYWWLDAGNERVSGQVRIGNSLDPEILLSPFKFCVGVPLPHVQDPSLIQPRERPVEEMDLSCADLTLREEQSAMINRFMANLIGVYLYRLLQHKDLDIITTYVNLEAEVMMRNIPINGGRVLKPPMRAPQQLLTLRPIAVAAPAQPAPPPPAAATAAETEQATEDGLELGVDICPQCRQGLIIAGETTHHGVLIRVRFCNQEGCGWREEGCLHCGNEVVVGQVTVQEGTIEEVVPGLICRGCGWHHAIPEARRSELAPPEEAASELAEVLSEAG
jgi:PRTRC genetic system ThiF family protein